MNQHSDNPRGNQLPAGVDEGQLVDAVKASGYPLQSLVAQELASRFEVIEEWGYTDRTTKEHRTLDIYAFCELGDGTGEGRPRLHLLVECKRSSLPFVFFPPGVPRMALDFPEVLGLGRFSLSLGNNTTQDASPATFFCAAESPFVGAARLAVSFTKAQRKSKELDLSGEMPFNQVVMPLASAVEQMRQIFRGVNGTPILVLSLCVVDAAMIVASGTTEAPMLQLEPWVRVVHQESVQDGNHWARRNYAIDFVHREFLTRYVADHAVPFATVLGARMAKYQKRHPKGTQAIRPKDLSWDAFIGT
jgi:hypothetical protein